MEKRFTEIEQIYIEKMNINVDGMSIIDLLKIREKAYEWAYAKRKEYGKNVEENKEDFILFLKGF